MKEPKYILRVAGQEFAVPDKTGIATLISMMEDVVPVDANLRDREIELTYTEDGDDQWARMIEFFREVRITKIPAGVKWKRKTKGGGIEFVQVVTKRAKLAAPETKRLSGREPARLGRGREPMQLEF